MEVDELKAYARSRVTIHRQYKRLLSALTCLLEAKIIKKKEFHQRRRAIEDLYLEMKEARKKRRPRGMRPVGRPPVEIVVTKCRKPGCSRPAENAGAYRAGACSSTRRSRGVAR